MVCVKWHLIADRKNRLTTKVKVIPGNKIFKYFSSFLFQEKFSKLKIEVMLP